MDLNRIDNWILNRTKKAIDKWLEMAKKRIDERSPTDTKEFIEWTKIKEAKISGSIVSWSVINDSSHAYWVEYWFSVHNGNPVYWHKWPPRWPWTRMVSERVVSMMPFRRSKIEDEDDILAYIKQQF